MSRYHRGFKPLSVRRSERKTKQKLILAIAISGVLLYSLIFWILPLFIGGLSIINKFKPAAPKEVVEDTTIAPPVLNIPYEATNSASIKIKGYAQPNTKVEIYLDDNLEETVSVDSDGNFLTDSISLKLGTNNFYGKTLDEENHTSLPSKNIRIFYDNDRPKLEISSPSDNQEFKGERKIQVSGIIEDKDSSTSVTVNGTRTIIDSEGKFNQTIELQDGENNISVVATDPAGNSSSLSRKVIFTP